MKKAGQRQRDYIRSLKDEIASLKSEKETLSQQSERLSALLDEKTKVMDEMRAEHEAAMNELRKCIDGARTAEAAYRKSEQECSIARSEYNKRAGEILRDMKKKTR